MFIFLITHKKIFFDQMTFFPFHIISSWSKEQWNNNLAHSFCQHWTVLKISIPVSRIIWRVKNHLYYLSYKISYKNRLKIKNRKNPQNLCWYFLVSSNTSSANPTKWSNRLKQFVSNSRRIFWVCLTILWGWRLKG